MVTMLRPHVQPYTIAFVEGGIRHWFYELSGSYYGYDAVPKRFDQFSGPMQHSVKTVCGLDRDRRDRENWALYDWEAGWDATCSECALSDVVIERRQPLQRKFEAAYDAFRDSDDRGLSWRHSVRAAVLAAEGVE